MEVVSIGSLEKRSNQLNISAGNTSLLQVCKCYWLRGKLVETLLLGKFYCKLEQEDMFLVH